MVRLASTGDRKGVSIGPRGGVADMAISTHENMILLGNHLESDPDDPRVSLVNFPWFRIDLSTFLLSIAFIECLEYPGYDYDRQTSRTYGGPGAAFGSLWLSLALLGNTVAGYRLSAATIKRTAGMCFSQRLSTRHECFRKIPE